MDIDDMVLLGIFQVLQSIDKNLGDFLKGKQNKTVKDPLVGIHAVCSDTHMYLEGLVMLKLINELKKIKS